MRILLSIVLVATLSGCALFSSPKEQPVIEDHVHNWFGVDKVGLLSTTAERREVIFKFPDNKFCAEPPPDVAEALASSLTLLAEGSATDKTTAQVSARLEAAKTLATSIRTLFRRSQGAQFFRDGLFNLCQAYVNRVITESQYVTLYNELLKRAQALVEKELPYMRAEKTEDAAENAASAEGAAKQAASEAAASAQQAKHAADRAEAAAKKPGPTQ